MNVTAYPTEDQESEVLAQWLRLHSLRFAHINNEMYTKSWKQKNRQVRMGTAKGVPDYLIVVPPERSATGQGYMLWVELKRVKLGVVSQSQREWIAALNDLDTPNVIAGVCKGADEAIELVQSYLKEPNRTEGVF